MSDKYIHYKEGFKYQLATTFVLATEIITGDYIEEGFIELTPDGTLILKVGFAWDGPSGPTIDTDDFMRGSAAHDALYELIRKGLLDKSWKRAADVLLIQLCSEDGMDGWRQSYVYTAVQKFGGKHLGTNSIKEVITAPNKKEEFDDE